MLRNLKSWCGLLLVLATIPSAQAFTLWGPLETFQTAALSYGTRFWYSSTFSIGGQPTAPGGEVYTELGGPKNFGAGSRLNVPTITYAFDYTFLKYFGPQGVAAVDAAFAILNKLPAASAASPQLTEFIQQGNQQYNYTAAALDMLDLKSTVLQLMLEHMGLLGETHVYDILAQNPLTSGGACESEYQVAIRNYDPVTYAPTPYVNGFLYDFTIQDGCSSGTAIADAMETLGIAGQQGLNIGPTGTTAVATAEALQIGGFYLGITRDDMGGLRYLYSKYNYNPESMPDATTYVGSTFTSQFTPVGTTNVTDNAWQGTVGGVEKITYVKVAYDSGVGTTFHTNVIHYNLNIATNLGNGSTTFAQVAVTRTNATPDIIFTAASLLGLPVVGADEPFIRTIGPTGTPSGTAVFIAPPGTANYAGQTVSQVMSPGMIVTFNNVGPLFVPTSENFNDGSTAFLHPFFQFGSFDGSTNFPIAYPTNTSLNALIQIETQVPSGQQLTSPFNPIASTNTTTAGGGAGAAGGGAAGGGTVAAVARPNGSK